MGTCGNGRATVSWARSSPPKCGTVRLVIWWAGPGASMQSSRVAVAGSTTPQTSVTWAMGFRLYWGNRFPVILLVRWDSCLCYYSLAARSVRERCLTSNPNRKGGSVSTRPSILFHSQHDRRSRSRERQGRRWLMKWSITPMLPRLRVGLLD